MPLVTRRIIGAAMAAAGCMLVPAVASAGVVVAASGPSASSYPVGKKIAGSERIVLRSGDTLTVLDGNGTRVLRGAGTYSLDQQGGPSQRSTFAVLTERRSRQRTGISASRTGEDGTPPNLWYVNVAQPGKVCLADPQRVRLWRPTTEGDATYLVRADGGGSHTVTFADGDTLAPWDTKLLPVSNGAVFHVAGPAGGPDKELSVVVLDQIAEEPEALAAQLIENGCLGQLEMLTTATLIEEE